MPKLPVVSPKRLLRFLSKFGFQKDYITGSHFILYNPTNGKRVVVPFHAKDLPKGTLMSILNQAGISRNDFLGSF
ncbi:hypothetical protein COX24_01500 [bacterium (Candidatus Gribaldobacteria) CG23_combo_of_CG06-09_8_20_14_all_37_87_8]|uniref:Toxin HicA n=2 Tax=Candidatus Gribaldobacteria TaxID=2798536 RepID=A0A2G9ZF84_9BACT|nr:MAG: hypothetical protein AUJ25_02850 [Parcubacteria group bacterium CG1_02_37_13]PIP31824.1 MAG: hypothetical protein COX24_01500 [bacterium (Candidatus Gribaldobacteria) CG23_combo_of_CG06-09_8_20_14_all_37_87_8]PIR90656.1 MAG: hypothetical protein COU05_00810 [bacterium (Candidatus Gribaldobacteria) CG10_big_fil_rev_8_21_14_0_10_37_21]